MTKPGCCAATHAAILDAIIRRIALEPHSNDFRRGLEVALKIAKEVNA